MSYDKDINYCRDESDSRIIWYEDITEAIKGIEARVKYLRTALDQYEEREKQHLEDKRILTARLQQETESRMRIESLVDTMFP